MNALQAHDNVVFRAQYTFNHAELIPRPASAAELAVTNSRVDGMHVIGEAVLAALGSIQDQHTAMQAQQAAMQAQQAALLNAINGVRKDMNSGLAGLQGQITSLDGKVVSLDRRIVGLGVELATVSNQVTLVSADLKQVKKDTSATLKMLVVVFGGIQLFFGWDDRNPQEQARMLANGLERTYGWVRDLEVSCNLVTGQVFR